MGQLNIQYDILPRSCNEWMVPKIDWKGGTPYPGTYKSKQFIDFEKHFGAYLKRLVKETNWDIEPTGDGKWILEVSFIQRNRGMDSSNLFKNMLDAMKGIVFVDDNNIMVRTNNYIIGNKQKEGFVAHLYKSEDIGIFRNQEHLDDFVESNCLKCKLYPRCAMLKKAKDNYWQEEMDVVNHICSKKK